MSAVSINDTPTVSAGSIKPAEGVAVKVEEKLPLVPEEITAEWLSSKLGHKIKSIKQTGAIWGTASKIFFTITYEEAESTVERPPAEICVKGGFIPELVKQLPPLICLYRVEAKFFNDVALKFKHMRLPKCWWAGENSEQGIIILDDLNVKNFTFGEPTEPWTVKRVKLAVEQLAALHGSTWGAKRADYPWVTDYSDTILGMFKAVSYHDFVRDPARPRLPEPYTNGPRVHAMLLKYFTSHNPKFQCLVHGDAHVGNTCITPGGEVNFIDWQLIDTRSCFHDVSYFVSAALTVENRRAYEMQILDHYLDCLARFGGPRFSSSEEDVLCEYKQSFLVGMGWVVTTTDMQPMARISVLIERFMAALVDHNVFEIVESLPESSAK